MSEQTTPEQTTDAATQKKKSKFWERIKSGSQTAGRVAKNVLIGAAVVAAAAAVIVVVPKSIFLVAARLALPLLLLGAVGYGAMTVFNSLTGKNGQKAAPEKKAKQAPVQNAPTKEPKPVVSRTPDFNIKSTHDTSGADTSAKNDNTASPAQKRNTPKR